MIGQLSAPSCSIRLAKRKQWGKKQMQKVFKVDQQCCVYNLPFRGKRYSSVHLWQGAKVGPDWLPGRPQERRKQNVLP